MAKFIFYMYKRKNRIAAFMDSNISSSLPIQEKYNWDEKKMYILFKIAQKKQNTNLQGIKRGGGGDIISHAHKHDHFHRATS